MFLLLHPPPTPETNPCPDENATAQYHPYHLARCTVRYHWDMFMALHLYYCSSLQGRCTSPTAFSAKFLDMASLLKRAGGHDLKFARVEVEVAWTSITSLMALGSQLRPTVPSIVACTMA